MVTVFVISKNTQSERLEQHLYYPRLPRLYLLAGLIFPQEGTVNAAGREVRKRQPETLGDMFILPDEFELPAVSIETFLEMRTPFYPKFRREVFDECLRAFEVEDNVALKSLSLGQKKKVLMRLLNSFTLHIQERFKRVMRERLSERFWIRTNM